MYSLCRESIQNPSFSISMTYWNIIYCKRSPSTECHRENGSFKSITCHEGELVKVLTKTLRRYCNRLKEEGRKEFDM